MSRALAKWSQHYMGQRVILQQWRHIAVTISRRHTREKGPRRANFDEAGLGGEDEEAEAEGYEEADDLAAAHTTRTAAGYGVTIDILKRLTSESLDVFGQASRRWHRFLGCAGEEEEAGPGLLARAKGEGQGGGGGKRKGGPAAEEAEARQAEKNKKKMQPAGAAQRRRRRASCCWKKAAEFRSAEQKEAIELAIAKRTPLVAVLPTGAGKSLVFMVPALLAGAGMTIVVTPFRALKAQLVGRCQKAGRAWTAAPGWRRRSSGLQSPSSRQKLRAAMPSYTDVAARPLLPLGLPYSYAAAAQAAGIRSGNAITEPSLHPGLKPDTLLPASQSERCLLSLASNKDVEFRLGWHVLKNTDSDAGIWTLEERNALEAEFLSSGSWTAIEPSN
ncbi:hypothetical protein EDB81DRAFT_916071 [Dactylonectria macrodidyma]|uniref:DEAD/DEAH-box helicase domain-containing protein n=1 Tax=Dactylonectria macrodidyma TaxID=307937 RepID=A0A9P9DDF4_9HYPO|nr:hypothetical protein EDB81DRAFT_916071 [Dactylonectria macrodidyma]